MKQTPGEAVHQVIDSYLSQQNLQHYRVAEGEWVVSLPGPNDQDIPVQLRLGDYTLFFSSFFMRAPEDNVLEVYRFLLRKNRELRGASFGLNEVGDIFLTAELLLTAVTADALDRHLGFICSYWEQSYGTVLKIGWAQYFQDDDGPGLH